VSVAAKVGPDFFHLPGALQDADGQQDGEGGGDDGEDDGEGLAELAGCQ